MKSIPMLMLILLAIAMILLPIIVLGQDVRFCGPPARDADGVIIRSSTVLREFERTWPKPASIIWPGGVQEGWIRDHVIPLACGGCDAVHNFQWLPETAWREKSKWERKVYGGRSISEGCP